MDLNEVPPEFDEDFLDGLNSGFITGDPGFCTQVPTYQHYVVPVGEPFVPIENPTFPEIAPTYSENIPTISEIRLSLEGTRLENNDEAASGNPTVNVVGDDATVVEEPEIWTTPQVPYTGMSFDSLEEAKFYYNAYAKRIGFSIRTNTSRRSAVTREMQKVQYVCNKEGSARKRKCAQNLDGLTCFSDNDESDAENIEEDEQDSEGEKRKKLDGCKKRKREKMTYTNCKARMVVKQIGSRWRVIYFLAEHNHDLVVKPSLKKFLRSHKGIPQQEKDFIVMLHGCNLSTGRIMQLMGEFYGSAQMVPYEGKDVANFRSTIRRAEKYKDMQETLDYFRELKQADPDFYYKIKLDENHRVENIFWVDSAARNAYKEAYSDCISFDATYMTNMYDMPFTPFIGINRHCQTFQLGCAFIRNEKTATYEWLFLTFLEAMGGKGPTNIITDQDAAMRSAITTILPNATHRNCRWHIMDKFSGTIGPILAKDEELDEEFVFCLNCTCTPQEFESKWSEMIHKHGLEGNEHFQHLYNIRQSFVPAYYMHNFFPFLQSTQRSEGFNGLLKKYVNPNMSILHFVQQYQKIQDKCLVAQDGQDYRSDENERRRWSKQPIERHASTVYTKNMFYRFSKELEKTAEYDVNPVGQFQYWLLPNNNTVFGYGKRNYLVTAVQEEESYFCECSKFDRDGILCCHIMRVMIRLGVKKIPEAYILKRWTPDAIPTQADDETNTQLLMGLVARGMPMNNRRTIRFTNLSAVFAELAIDGSISDETYGVMEKHIKQMRSELTEIKMRKRGNRKRSGRDGPQGNTRMAGAGANVSAPSAGLNQMAGAGTNVSAPSAGLNQMAGAGTNVSAPSAGLNQMAGAGTNVSAPSAGLNLNSMGPSNASITTEETEAHQPDDASGNVGNPPKSKAKGRKKEKRHKKGMNAQEKRKNKCSICKSTDHNAARCPKKLGREPQVAGRGGGLMI